MVQAASDDPEDNRVVWSCCKNNDGREGPRSAWERRNGLFKHVPDFDWEEFDHPGKSERVTITEDDMAKVFAHGKKTLARPEAVKALVEMTKAGRSSAYAALDLDTGRFADRLAEIHGVLTWK